MSGPQPASITRASAAAWQSFTCLLPLKAQRSVLCLIPIAAEHLSYRKMKPKLQKDETKSRSERPIRELGCDSLPPGVIPVGFGPATGTPPSLVRPFSREVAQRHESCAL